jgi:hypothetical protein
MPEQDFELYLSLLSRFLRLNPAQRDDIADELRDHLEQRLEELAARGLSREEAIRQALDEFGNAAELASHFTKAAHIRRRRLIMRCTFGTVAALAASLLVATAFWPATPHNPIAGTAVAESEKPAVDVPVAAVGAAARRETAHFLNFNPTEDRIRRALDQPTEVAFNEQPLEEAIRYLSAYHGINIWINRQALLDSGVAADTPVTLQLSEVTFRSTLKLLLEPLDLTYVIEDEVMKITTFVAAGNVIGVYNVRDLIGRADAKRTRSDGDDKSPVDPQITRAAASGKARGVIHESSSLAELVATTIEPKSWTDAGGEGTVVQYNDILVVRNRQLVHDRVNDFLKSLRLALEDSRAGEK